MTANNNNKHSAQPSPSQSTKMTEEKSIKSAASCSKKHSPPPSPSQSNEIPNREQFQSVSSNSNKHSPLESVSQSTKKTKKESVKSASSSENYQDKDTKELQFNPEVTQITYYPPTGEILGAEIVKLDTSETAKGLRKLTLVPDKEK